MGNAQSNRSWRWNMTNIKEVMLCYDGSALGNPGPSGIGVVYKDWEGRVLGALNKALGSTNSYLAEVQVIVDGVEQAVEASTNQVVEKHMPVYQLSLKILYCVIDVQLKAEVDTDEMNRNIWEVISVCESLNIRWEGEGRKRKMSFEDMLHFYGPRSQVTRKESLLDKVAQKETELEAVLEDLGIGRKKRVNIRVKKAARLMKGICFIVEEERVELKRKKVELEKNVARLKSDLSKEWKQLKALKASHVVEISKLWYVARMDLDKVVVMRDRLGRHLVSKGYSEEEVEAIRADTYVEEEEVKDDVVGVVDGLDGMSPQLVKDNQEDDDERPEVETEKGLKDIRLRIKDLPNIRYMFREKGLERIFRRKKIVIKVKEELLKKILDVEEQNKKIEVLRTQVVDLEVINRAESAKADEKSVENIAFSNRIEREMARHEAWYKRGDCTSSMGIDFGTQFTELMEEGRIAVIARARGFMASRPPIVKINKADIPTVEETPL
ncbi:hypothetical protein GIB67_000026 [Kingdonia uniflora]|uniref:RNase H type-1 domain-containing protein n=1 Tax=Kingdonia uniflora TaxID=39325 RepID=A0A7J7MNV7_9MAGN|nr:hypothetical protein GIB67_000026 [Kingdonia uniflora]